MFSKAEQEEILCLGLKMSLSRLISYYPNNQFIPNWL